MTADDLRNARALIGTPDVGKDAGLALAKSSNDRDAHDILRAALPIGYTDVSAWSDRPATTFAQIARLFDRALATVAQREFLQSQRP